MKLKIKKQCEIIALHIVAGFADIIVDGTDFNRYSDKEKDMIIEHIDKICNSLKEKATKMEQKSKQLG